MDKFEEITLNDPVSNRSYSIRLSPGDAEKARNDMQFASALLRYAQSIPLEKKVAAGETHPSAACGGTTAVKPSTASTKIVEETITSNTVQSKKVTVAAAAVPSTARASQDATDDDGMHIWSKAQSRLLISLYGENEEMFSSGGSSQKQCWARISENLAEKGHIIPGPKCDSKFQSLKRTYKAVKDHNNKSGNSKRSWEFFEDMENIFKKKPWVKPISTAGSDDIDCDLPIVKSKAVKSKQSQYLQALLQHKKEQAIKRDIQHTEKLNALAELRDLLRQHLNNT